jgi:hypothetical protein
MNPYMMETLSRQRSASLMAEARWERLAQASRRQNPGQRVPRFRKLVALLGGWVAAASRRPLEAVGRASHSTVSGHHA